MKRFFSILMIAGLLLPVVSCQRKERQTPLTIGIQLQFDGAPFDVDGINIVLSDAGGIVDYTAVTNASGYAEFRVPAGPYNATSVYKITRDGERISYNGEADILVSTEDGKPFVIDLLKVVSQQVIIKELYNGGTLAADGLGAYQSDQYFVIYNNSSEPVDVSNLVFGIGAPYESYSANAYYGDSGELLYEHEDWTPAGGALWWFKSESVIMDPYSEIVVAVAAAIDHTVTNPNSVDLSVPDYYWMCNVGVGQMYDRARKYQVSEKIPQEHYLTGKAFAMTPTGWPLSTASPTFFIGRMDREECDAMCLDTPSLDQTLGAMFKCVKFPKSKMVDAVEIWAKGNEGTSHVRFSADVNSNYVLLTPKLGYSVYRNVDKEATEALPENEGKLVYGYAGGTDDVEGSTDPSGIDAEASIANGAHILYSDTNNSFIDFHQRKVTSLKK